MIEKVLKPEGTGYEPTRAEVRFRLPGNRSVFSSIVWEGVDRAPEYPKLFGFLADWDESIDGTLQSVTVSRKCVRQQGTWRKAGKRILLH
ncbi:aspartate-semialdehyde dehydrogenase [Tabrizicola sp.]|uniref:aspartate-semialdehyde dehydrogenase n=1 Tax=Tabrizicola sp. TaxID=2005166 RepID=UPI003F324627